MDWVNAIIAAVGVGVTCIVAWTSTRTTRARRRAEEAQLALRLLESRRFGVEDRPADDKLEERLFDTARFATVEFTRLILDDGPRWWSILPVFVYGVMLVVAGRFMPDAVPVFMVIAGVCLVYSAGAVWIKRRRSRRLREAGVHVPSLRELLETELSEWADVWATRRVARARRVAVARRKSPGAKFRVKNRRRVTMEQ